MSKPKIFISHSCKDLEINSPSVSQESRDRLKYAQCVRDKIVDKLQPDFEILLDRKRLEPGDEWKAKLHWWLGMCHGAVILLNQESTRSDWVRKEATILTWRKSLRNDLRIIPVILGDFASSSLEETGFGPLDVMISQASRLGVTAMTEENADLLAEQVKNGFQGFQPQGMDDNKMMKWVQNVAALLAVLDTHAREVFLDRARRCLSISDEDWSYFNDRPKTLAYQLLHSPYANAYSALIELSTGLSQPDFERLRDYVLPVWVDATAAQMLMPESVEAVESKPRRLAQMFTLNASDPTTATDYVDRAFCCFLYRNRIIDLSTVAGEGETEELIARLRNSLVKQLALRREELLSERLAQNPFFVRVISEPHPLPAEWVQQLQEAFPEVTYILLAGSDFSGMPKNPVALKRLTPALEKDSEQKVLIEKGRLLDLFRKEP